MDRYNTQNCPSSCKKITIKCILEAEVHFLFEHDSKAEMFLLDPSSMRLKPNKKQAGDGQIGQAL